MTKLEALFNYFLLFHVHVIAMKKLHMQKNSAVEVEGQDKTSHTFCET